MTPIVASTAYCNVFSVHCHNGAFVNTVTKLCQAKGWGQRFDDNAWLSVISAVSVMKANGARNARTAARKMTIVLPTPQIVRRTSDGFDHDGELNQRGPSMPRCPRMMFTGPLDGFRM